MKVPRSSKSISQQRILVVDDDENIRSINAMTLKGAGYDVEASEDGEAAWHSLQKKRYDLVVTDNNMPKLSGVGLLKRMRDSSISLPVVMATGNPPFEYFAQNPRLSPTATLVKPYSLRELVLIVEKVLRNCGGE